MRNYLPFYITTEEDAKRMMMGHVSFAPAIPEGYCRKNYYNSIIAESPNYRLGVAEQFKSGAIIDLSDFSSSILTLFQLEYNADGFLAPDPRLKEQGDTAVVITDPAEFFIRLQKANDTKYPDLKRLYAQDVVYDDVIYYNNLSDDVFNPFIHRADDSWKKETIIISRVKELISLDQGICIGDSFQIPNGLHDIAVVIPIEDLYSEKVLRWNLPANITEVSKPPVITDTTIRVSGNIQDISPKEEWIKQFQYVLDSANWQPITKMITSSDGKSVVPCLTFVNSMTGDEIKLMVNTCEFTFHGVYTISIFEKTLALIEQETKTRFCNPSIVIGADMGEITGQQKYNVEFDLRKAISVEGRVHWFGLQKNTLVTTNNFGTFQSELNRWLLREQITIPDLTLWYDKNEIISFIQKASKDISDHLCYLVDKDIVSEIMRV